MTPSIIRTPLPLRATSHHQQRTWKSVDCESQGGEQGPAGGQKVGYGGGKEEEGGFVERIVVAQVQVHNLLNKGDPDLVTLSYRFYLYGRTHADQSVCTYSSRFPLLILLSWVQEVHSRKPQIFEYGNVSCLANSKCAYIGEWATRGLWTILGFSSLQLC